MRSVPKLKVVRDEPVASASVHLAKVVPELIAAEALAARLRASVKSLGHKLAAERGVAFLREEQLRREFGRE